ncbi:hypothetical protein QE375_002997 [Microbacterium foliorum]|uniref:Uncharacterized protein n=1 Tax=Microbacterium foliorum TaxID=104336 RepID=A0ABU1HTS5_9MICO|nr:hypothetical protein [Microbacterium foliorum]MDR6143443.1 hypothetical protein [Microbacterium foliorum]
MSFHIEHTLDGRRTSTGSYDTLGEAVIAALGVRRAPVLVVEDSAPGDADAVAVVLKKGEVLTATAEPEWWGRVTKASQQKLLAGSRLDAAVVTDLTDAGGAVAATAWESGPVEEWELTPASDHDWVRFEAARRAIRG